MISDDFVLEKVINLGLTLNIAKTRAISHQTALSICTVWRMHTSNISRKQSSCDANSIGIQFNNQYLESSGFQLSNPSPTRSLPLSLSFLEMFLSDCFSSILSLAEQSEKAI